MGFPRGKLHRRLLVMSLPLCLPAIALADGKVFPRVAVTTIPNQQALIHYADGVETLVVETRFIGDGQDFAWVVPTPSVPEVSEVTAGLFPTLRSILRPHLIDQVTPFALPVAGIAILVLGLHFKRGRLAIGLFITGGVITAWVLLPTLGIVTVRSAGVSAGDAIIVHSQARIGAFDVAVISSEDPDALLNWLRDNDYRVGEEAVDAIKAYVNEDWSFAAAKLHREQATEEPSTPHPLAFQFATDKPVYPLRLTGAGNGPCSIGLYIFGDQRAAAPGFSVERCNTCWYSPDGEIDPRAIQTRITGVPVVHPQLLKLVGKAQVVTHLTATLQPEEMNDAYLAWEPFEPARTTLYSIQAARKLVLNLGASILMLGLLLLVVARKRYAMTGRAFAGGIASLALAALLTSSIVYGSLDKTSATESGLAPMIAERMLGSFGFYLEEQIADSKGQPLTLEDIVREAEGLVEQDYYSTARRGFKLESGDGPGQYQIRQTEQGFVYVWYDRWGGEHVEKLTLPPASAPAATPPVIRDGGEPMRQ